DRRPYGGLGAPPELQRRRGVNTRGPPYGGPCNRTHFSFELRSELLAGLALDVDNAIDEHVPSFDLVGHAVRELAQYRVTEVAFAELVSVRVGLDRVVALFQRRHEPIAQLRADGVVPEEGFEH